MSWPKWARRGPMEMAACIVIALGIFMMLQPFALVLFTYSFVTTLAGAAGQVRTARSNGFGYFQFDDVAAGQTYLLSAQSKRYTFAPQAVNVQDDVVGLVVTAE